MKTILVLSCLLMSMVHAAPDPDPTAAELELMRAAIPPAPRVAPGKPRRVLVCSLVPTGYRHKAIPYGKLLLELMAEQTEAFEAVVSDDLEHFESDQLTKFDVVFLNNANNELFLPANLDHLDAQAKAAALERDTRLKQNLVRFLEQGGGLAVLHAGVASFRKWPEYGSIIGARFENHPWGAGSTISVKVGAPSDPITQAFTRNPFPVSDEIYQFKEWSRDQLRVLLSINTADTDMDAVQKWLRRSDQDFALSWVKPYASGRVFYLALGHDKPFYWNPEMVQFLLDGIQFAAGDLASEVEPLAR